ncbi:hypothetical protein QM012_003366 [Aureobasidium pullulans]|uniref:Uncharacterized protein n=1 Tax=Aureobasidium pullulans TaxID=5580 RepID=A0ABR0T9H0_AURPU
MGISHPDPWPSLTSILDLIVSVGLTILDMLNCAARVIRPFFWAALEWMENMLVIAGNALLAATLALLLWISIIYLCCFTIFMFCRLLRRHERYRKRGERQPLLAHPQRRRRLPSWTHSNSSSGRRRFLDHTAYRDLFQADLERRRQDALRREQHRAVETRSREYRERRLREALRQSPSTPLYRQPQTIMNWLQASSNPTTITHHPSYGTLPTRGAQRPERRADPPPPYSQNSKESPPPYSNPRSDIPPSYD